MPAAIYERANLQICPLRFACSDLTDLCSQRCAHCFEHKIRRRPTDRREVIKRMTRIFFCTRISPIARMLVRAGTLTWRLLNENDTNEINTDSTRSFVNTNCLCSVLNRIFRFFFSNYLKASFHCSHLSKRIQIFIAVHILCLKLRCKDSFPKLSPNLRVY